MEYYAAIVGFGVAGSSLALRFLEAGIPVLILSEKRENDSSRVAAGLLNPYAPKRIMPGWNGEAFVREAHTFYADIQEKSGISFYQKLNMYKVFPNTHYKNDWVKNQALYPQYTSEPVDCPNREHIHAPYQGGFIYETGIADGRQYLEAAYSLCGTYHTFLNEKWDPEALQFEQGKYSYKGYRFSKLIFAQGMGAKENPLTAELDLQALKGDILRMRIKAFSPACIYQTRHFLASGVGLQQFVFGSTYQRDFSSTHALEEDKIYLEKMLTQMGNFDIEEVEHEAGLRPCSFDRKPYVGKWQESETMFIFNGLGSKGYLLAPLLSKKLFDHITYEIDMWADVDPMRKRKIKTYPTPEHAKEAEMKRRVRLSGRD